MIIVSQCSNYTYRAPEESNKVSIRTPKVYTMDQLSHPVLSDDTLCALFEHNALFYSVVVGFWRATGDTRPDVEIISHIRTTDNWVDDAGYTWGTRQYTAFRKSLINVLRNVYQIGHYGASVRSDWYISIYGPKMKSTSKKNNKKKNNKTRKK